MLHGCPCIHLTQSKAMPESFTKRILPLVHDLPKSMRLSVATASGQVFVRQEEFAQPVFRGIECLGGVIRTWVLPETFCLFIVQTSRMTATAGSSWIVLFLSFEKEVGQGPGTCFPGCATRRKCHAEKVFHPVTPSLLEHGLHGSMIVIR